MAVRTSSPQRGQKRISLTRGKSSPGRNVRREPKRERRGNSSGQGLRALHFPSVPKLTGLRDFFSTTFFISIILLIVAAVSVGLIYTYSRLVSGDYFALKTLEIQGTSRLSSREILETADLTDGGNILALSIDAVEDALANHPWVEDVSVKRILPGTLIIRLREKTPAFWVLHEGELQYADARGRLIAPVIPGKFASLPALEVEAGAEDTAAVLPDLVKSLQESRLPLHMGTVSVVRLSAARGVELYMEESRLKISIGLEEWAPNLRRLGRTLADLTRRGELKDIREIKAQGANVWVEKIPGTAPRQG